jgi:hypothetical protein
MKMGEGARSRCVPAVKTLTPVRPVKNASKSVLSQFELNPNGEPAKAKGSPIAVTLWLALIPPRKVMPGSCLA